jgi:hypothetical protein
MQTAGIPLKETCEQNTGWAEVFRMVQKESVNKNYFHQMTSCCVLLKRLQSCISQSLEKSRTVP